MRNARISMRTTWRQMLNRCYNEKNDAYHRYGGRGIKVCDRWLIYENFLEDVGLVPDGLTIDRINNESDYEPGNIRYGDAVIQANNRHNNHRLEWNGENKTIAEWSRLTGVKPYTILARLEYGWTVEETLSTPVEQEQVYQVNGKEYRLFELAKETGLTSNTLKYRLEQGWDLETVLSKSTEVSKRYPYRGKELTLEELSNIAGIASHTIDTRIRAGQSVEEAAEKPLEKQRQQIEYQGETYDLKALAKKIGMSRSTLTSRLSSGMSLDEAISKPVQKKSVITV